MFPALLGDTNWQQMTQMTWNVTFETKCDINVIDVIPWSTIVLRGQRSPAGHARPLGGVEAAAPKCLPPLPPVCPPHVKNHMKMFQNNQQNKFTAIFCVKKNLEQMRPTPSDTVCAWVCVGFGLDALMHGIPSDICVWCSDPESPKTSGRSKLSPSSCNQHPPCHTLHNKYKHRTLKKYAANIQQKPLPFTHPPEASAKKTECSVFKRSHLRTARHKERGQSCGNATAAAITHESEAYRSFDTEISNDTSKPGTWMDLVKSAHLNEQLFIAGRKWRWKSYI